jgi:hypothetical protein
MPGNSDKSSEKPKPVQTVQTLLAAKNGNEKQKKKTPKRPNIEVSMDIQEVSPSFENIDN